MQEENNKTPKESRIQITVQLPENVWFALGHAATDRKTSKRKIIIKALERDLELEAA